MDRDEDDDAAHTASEATYESPARALNESTQAPRRAVPDAVAETVPNHPSGRPSRPLQDAMRSVFDVPRQRFDEVAELGRGGMGRVVEAVDRTLSRTVAIKHMLETDHAGLARFEREVRITARLQHPGIVPVLDVGRDDDGQPYYVMRKIEGNPLADRVKAAQTARDRLALVPAVLGAVDACAYAHAQGIVHRDIKPWNILLGSFGETLLIDWGLARELGTSDDVPPSTPRAAANTDDDGLTRVGQAYGTPGYMAPEQARGEPADRRADVYSLGATLYFVLTGTSPFLESGATVAIQRASLGERPDLGLLPEEVPVELVAILSKALAPERSERYRDAGELAADLRRFLAGQLVAAHHYTLPQLAGRWLRRHLLVTSVVGLAVAIVVTVGVYAVRRVVSERDEARAARTLAEGRAEDLLVDRARSLVTVDPTGAAALLRSLPRTSSRWPAASEVVRAAVAAGVERAVKVGTENIADVAVSPSGQLASLDTDGNIYVHEAATFKPRLVIHRYGSQLAWIDDATLLIITYAYSDYEHNVAVLDVRSGSILHEANLGPVTSHERVFGALFVLFEGGRLVAFEKAGQMRDVASGVRAIGVNDDWLVLAFENGLDKLSASGERQHIPIEATTSVWGVAVSRSGDRVAVGTGRAITEFDLRRGTNARYDKPASSIEFFAYVGERLFEGLTDGGAVAVTERLVTQQWYARGKPFPLARFAGGAFVATDDGGIGLIDAELGVLPMVRRVASIDSVAVDPRGAWVAIGSANGVVQILDLGAARPRTADVANRMLLAADGRHIVLADLNTGPDATYWLVDTDTLSMRRFGHAGFSPFAVLTADHVIVGTVGNDATVTAWSFAGEQQWTVSCVNWAVGRSLHAEEHLYYVTSAGDLFERPLDGSSADRLVYHMESVTRPDGTRMPPIVGLAALDSVLVLSVVSSEHGTIGMKVRAIDDKGQRWVELGDATVFGRIARGADGRFWAVSESGALLRERPGTRPDTFPFPGHVRTLMAIDNEMWVIGEQSMYRYDALTGALLSATQATSNYWAAVSDRVLSASPRGVDIVSPRLNTRRTLPLPSSPNRIYASDSVQTIVAYIQLLYQSTIAVWHDPVPADPALVPAYLEHVTNARMNMSSDAITWDW